MSLISYILYLIHDKLHFLQINSYQKHQLPNFYFLQKFFTNFRKWFLSEKGAKFRRGSTAPEPNSIRESDSETEPGSASEAWTVGESGLFSEPTSANEPDSIIGSGSVGESNLAGEPTCTDWAYLHSLKDIQLLRLLQRLGLPVLTGRAPLTESRLFFGPGLETGACSALRSASL